MLHNEILKNAVKYCNFCKHRRIEIPFTCDAFPNGIPDDVLIGKRDHQYPVEGDNGIHFEPLEEYTESKPWLVD